MDYLKEYEKWLAYDGLDTDLREELKTISNPEQIRELFSKELEFGTAGLRGIMGAGTNRMNVHVVRKTTQGLASYIIEEGKEEKGVVIAYDSRNNSYEFARESARVLSANNVKVYLFESLRPTPMLSFAVRHLGCAAGIVITASHNPKEYNGYKVYGEDGGQAANELANAIQKKIEQTDIFADVKYNTDDSGIIMIGKEVDEEYYKKAEDVIIDRDVINKASDLKFVYTPFHGSGNVPVREILKRTGFTNVSVVKEQELPDGDFPTVASPNPENIEGFALAIELAKKEKADLIIGTDPDADRVGLVAKTSDGTFKVITGNQLGALLTQYILDRKKETNTLPQNPVIITTIVSSRLAEKIAKSYNAEVCDVLTGFKYIADKIHEYEQTKEKTYLLGFEESYGYLPVTHVRDKDAVVASLLIAEMAAYYSLKNMTLHDALAEIFEKYGTYRELTVNIQSEGVDGIEKIANAMKSLRENLPQSFMGVKVKTYSDYLEGKTVDIKTGEETKTGLPSSNVLRFILEDETFIAFRPSGTEPKFKIYVGVVDKNPEDFANAAKELINI